MGPMLDVTQHPPGGLSKIPHLTDAFRDLCRGKTIPMRNLNQADPRMAHEKHLTR
jgi:hypothetical protein